MDELLTYEYFIEKYPDSKMTKDEYNIFYNIAKNYILKKIVYDYYFLNDDYKKQIQFYILYQVNYFKENGDEKQGIVSLSINGVSRSFNTDEKKCELNISSIVKNWLNGSVLTMRRI